MNSFADTDKQSIPQYEKICRQCGTLNVGGSALPGHGWIEAVLWLFYLVPGLIYSIWRRSKRQAVCIACGSRDLVQVGTPVGATMLRTHHPDVHIDKDTPMTRPVPAAKSYGPKWLGPGRLLLIAFVGVMAVVFIAGLVNRLGR
jgi:hypothetical protein